MKKGLKTILTVLFAAVFFMSLVPARSEAALAEKTAYLAYADEGWIYQYWGDPVDTGVIVTNANITGAGKYTVGLDFTATEGGKALGVAFAAPIIANGNVAFEGYFVQIDSIVVNGEKIEFTKNYTSSDDNVELRSNIFNEWVSALPDDARTPDGDLSDASAIISDRGDFAEVETISVSFTLIDPNGASADAPTATPKTGVTSMALVYGLGALVTGAFVLKKKEK